MSERLLVLGDVHGAARALLQVLDRARFNPSTDRLIFLGDVCDGWPEVPECVDILREAGAECIWGNHDAWTAEWLQDGGVRSYWYAQGGRATFDAYGGDVERARRHLRPFFGSLRDFIYDEGRGYLFVHGGIPRANRKAGPHTMPSRNVLMWDRTLYEDAIRAVKNGAPAKPLTRFSKAFIGHTQTNHLGYNEPLESAGVVLLDQGAGWPPGRLSLMDADTGEFWQSDVASELYPDVQGRAARPPISSPAPPSSTSP